MYAVCSVYFYYAHVQMVRWGISYINHWISQTKILDFGVHVLCVCVCVRARARTQVHLCMCPCVCFYHIILSRYDLWYVYLCTCRHGTQITLLIRWFNKSATFKVCTVVIVVPWYWWWVCCCLHAAALVGICILCYYGEEACHWRCSQENTSHISGRHQSKKLA